MLSKLSRTPTNPAHEQRLDVLIHSCHTKVQVHGAGWHPEARKEDANKAKTKGRSEKKNSVECQWKWDPFSTTKRGLGGLGLMLLAS